MKYADHSDNNADIFKYCSFINAPYGIHAKSILSIYSVYLYTSDISLSLRF